ncbi:MAG: response regulator [Acidobacteriia bacterium]|nr:response regulator [Terriglobia bacterium]
METRILVVDDEEAVASMMKIVLENDGYTVVTAASAAEAVGLLSTDSFQAVITDMKMESDTAGYDVVRAARALPNPPVTLILTGYPLLAQDWRAAGAAAVASKPSSMAQLLETVAELLGKRRQRATRLA